MAPRWALGVCLLVWHAAAQRRYNREKDLKENQVELQVPYKISENNLLIPDPEGDKQGPCKDSHDNCTEWSHWGECEANQKLMSNLCPATCGLCPMTDKERAQWFAGMKAACKDQHEDCESWAFEGRCSDANDGIFQRECRDACGLCPMTAMDKTRRRIRWCRPLSEQAATRPFPPTRA